MDPCENQEEIDKTELEKNFMKKKNALIANAVKEHVLPFLPAKSLCQCRAVCRDWREWLSSPFLAHKQTVFFREVSGIFWQFPGSFQTIDFISLRQPVYGVPDPSLSFLPEEVTIKASCNGLICCQSVETSNSYYLCNPVTKEWKSLPDPKYYHGPESAVLLAFEPGLLKFRESYELFCAIPSKDTDLIMFEIFSSRSNSWRVSETVCDELEGAEFTGGGLFLDGVLYWEVVIRSETETRFVLTFNVTDEHYGIIELPESSGPSGTLTVIRGEVCYIVPEKYPLEVHIYGGLDMSLKRRVELRLGELYNYLEDAEECFRALACLKHGDVMLFLLGTNLLSYCISTQKVEVLNSDSMHSSNRSRYFLHVNSLVNIRSPPLVDM